MAALSGPDGAWPPDVLAQAMERPRPRAVLGVLPLVRRIPGSATFPWGVVDMARQAGLGARWRPLAGTDRLLASLARGEVPLVIMGGWRPRPWAHYAVLVAWDDVRGWGFADSFSPHAEIVWRSEDAFRRLWRAFGQLLITLRTPVPPIQEPTA